MKNKDYQNLMETTLARKDAEIRVLVKAMEEMAGLPREDLGKRQPGEKCKYEC